MLENENSICNSDEYGAAAQAINTTTRAGLSRERNAFELRDVLDRKACSQNAEWAEDMEEIE